MKKLICLLTVTMLMATNVFGAEKVYNVYVDNNLVELDTQPEVFRGYTYVPISFIAREFGATVTWERPTVTIVKDDVELVLTVGSNVVYKNGVKSYTDYNVFLTNGRVMVPVRLISDAFGYAVDYSENNNGTNINGNIKIDTTKQQDTNNGFVENNEEYVLTDDGKFGYKVKDTDDPALGKIQIVYTKNMETGEIYQVFVERMPIEELLWTTDNQLLYTYVAPKNETRVFRLFNPANNDFSFVVDCYNLYYIPSLNSILYTKNAYENNVPTENGKYNIMTLSDEKNTEITKAEYEQYLEKYKNEIIER